MSASTARRSGVKIVEQRSSCASVTALQYLQQSSKVSSKVSSRAEEFVRKRHGLAIPVVE
jgi:hypothetical protein